jgi:hypothetical protein
MQSEKPGRQSTPEEEGIELRPDAWERFERTLHQVVKARPARRTVETTAEDRPKAKSRGRRAKSSG